MNYSIDIIRFVEFLLLDVDDDNLPMKRGMGMRIQRRNSIPRICGKKAVYVSMLFICFLFCQMRCEFVFLPLLDLEREKIDCLV